MIRSDCFVSVVAPLHNDEDIVEAFLKELSDLLSKTYTNYEIVFVDDGSDDGTVETIRQLLPGFACVRLVCLSRSFGLEVAITAGLETVIGDYVVVMLPDSDPPAVIPEMVLLAQRGAGVVQSVVKARGQEPWFMRWGSRLFYWYCRRAMGMSVPKNAAHLRVMSRQAVNAVTQIKDRLRYTRGFAAYVGYHMQLFHYAPISRRSERRRPRLLTALNQATSIIISNSIHPLRLLSIIGLVISLLNLAYIAYVAMTYLFSDRVAEGWVTQSVQTSTMFFFLFLIVTVLCEYIARILNEVQDRPLYYVKAEMNSPTVLADEERRNVVNQ